ncbi:MAG: hypothetical protein ACK44F_01530 [Roseococcus sp.]|jgi:hypothetical protein
MRRALILALLAPLLMAQGGVPRARCDFGAGREALRGAEELARAAPEDLLEGRARGERLTLRLREAVTVFLGCGCPLLAESVAEAAGLAAQLPGEADFARMARGVEALRGRIALARERMERQACR